MDGEMGGEMDGGIGGGMSGRVWEHVVGSGGLVGWRGGGVLILEEMIEG